MSFHCWHHTNFALGNGAGQYVCCNCGKTAYATIESEVVIGHGPHHPRPNYNTTRVPDASGCPYEPTPTTERRTAGEGT